MTTLISVFLKIAPFQDVDAEGATSCITEQSFLFRNEWCIDFRTESNFCFCQKGVAFLAIVYCIQYLSALSAYGSFQYNQIERGPIQQDLSPNERNDLEMARIQRRLGFERRYSVVEVNLLGLPWNRLQKCLHHLRKKTTMRM